MFQALFNSLSGLFSFSRSLNTVSNNVANMHTLSTIFGAGLGSEAALRERERHCVEVALGYLRP